MPGSCGATQPGQPQRLPRCLSRGRQITQGTAGDSITELPTAKGESSSPAPARHTGAVQGWRGGEDGQMHQQKRGCLPRSAPPDRDQAVILSGAKENMILPI